MSFDLLRRALVTRRAFVSGAAVGSLTGLPAMRTAEDTEDLAGAERLLGLEWSMEERALAAPRVVRHRGDLEQIRAFELDRDTPPALRFDPLPATVASPRPGGGVEFTAEATATQGEEDLAFASVHQLATLLRTRRVTSRQLTELAIRRLEKHDPTLQCVITLMKEHALAAADEADREMARGEFRSPLHGIPFGAKDLLAHPAAPTTFADVRPGPRFRGDSLLSAIDAAKSRIVPYWRTATSGGRRSRVTATASGSSSSIRTRTRSSSIAGATIRWSRATSTTAWTLKSASA